MNKFHIVKQLKFNGDSIITIKNDEPILVTTDFSTKHIRKRRHKRETIKKAAILVYSWNDEKFRNIDVSSILHIQPLGTVLNNESPEIIIDG